MCTYYGMIHITMDNDVVMNIFCYVLANMLGVSSFPPSSYWYRLVQTDKIAIKSNAELARSFSKICVRNHQTCQKFVCGISKITIFFDKRSMQKWRQHDKMAACFNFRQFRVVEDDLKLFCDVFH